MQGLLDSGGGGSDDDASAATLGPGMGLTSGSGSTDPVVQPDPGPSTDGYDGPVISNRSGGGQTPVHNPGLFELLRRWVRSLVTQIEEIVRELT